MPAQRDLAHVKTPSIKREKISLIKIQVFLKCLIWCSKVGDV
jgi:hypothetical protein